MIEKTQTTVSSISREEQAILQEVLASNSEIKQELDYIHRYIRRGVLWGYIRFAFIIIPLLLSIIYLPPFVKDILSLLGPVR